MSIQGQMRQFVAVVVQNIPDLLSEQMTAIMSRPLELQKGLLSLFTSLIKTGRIFKVWKRIKPFIDLEIYDALVSCKIVFKGFAEAMISCGDFKNSLLAVNPRDEFDLVILTTKDLLGNDGTLLEIFVAAEKMGFKKCEPWMAAKIRIAYSNQPMDELLFIGMDPLLLGNLSVIFKIEKESGGKILGSWVTDGNSLYDSSWKWVFVLPRKKETQPASNKYLLPDPNDFSCLSREIRK